MVTNGKAWKKLHYRRGSSSKVIHWVNYLVLALCAYATLFPFVNIIARWFPDKWGDTHPSLDKMDGSIEASDFRLRLEIGGCLERISAQTDQDGAEVRIHNTPVRLHSWHTAFGNTLPDEAAPWKWEINRVEGVMGIDLVIYAGQRKTIEFRNMSSAAFLFSLIFGHREEDFVPEIEDNAEQVRLRGMWRERELQISIPACPVEQ